MAREALPFTRPPMDRDPFAFISARNNDELLRGIYAREEWESDNAFKIRALAQKWFNEKRHSSGMMGGYCATLGFDGPCSGWFLVHVHGSIPANGKVKAKFYLLSVTISPSGNEESARLDVTHEWEREI